MLSTKLSHVTSPHALKGQKLSSTKQYTKLLPFQGALLITFIPRACPGLGASALSGRVEPTCET